MLKFIVWKIFIERWIVIWKKESFKWEWASWSTWDLTVLFISCHFLDLTVLCSMDIGCKDIVGCIYASHKRIHLFVGKVLWRFLSDDNSPSRIHHCAWSQLLGSKAWVYRLCSEGKRKEGCWNFFHPELYEPVKANFLGGQEVGDSPIRDYKDIWNL